jgi:hypothetical protein
LQIENWQLQIEGGAERGDLRSYVGNILVLASGWLGFAGASDDEILAAEERLKVELPPSYRSFLAASNGWHIPSWFVYELWPVSKITWFSEHHQDWIDAYVEPARGSRRLTDEEYLIYGEKQSSVHFREEYLQSALQISDVGDSAVMLLNPAIKTSFGGDGGLGVR